MVSLKHDLGENKRFKPNEMIALITGASSGIGAAIARELVRHRITVLLAARRQGRLEQLSDEIRNFGGNAQFLSVDLRHETDRQRLFELVRENYGSLHMLINNAGLGWYGYYTNMPWETASELLQVNVTAVAHLTRLFLPVMKEQNYGHIINIGSISGGLPSQGIALYGASKSFLDSFSTALYRELKGSKVNVSVVRAGPVKSEFYEQAAQRVGGKPIPAERFAVSSESVAKKVWELVLRPRRAIYIPRVLQIVPWLELLFGGLIDRLGPMLLRRQYSER